MSAYKDIAHLALHQHGKSRVRVGRVWRLPSGEHVFVEWQVATVLESDMERAFTDGDNTGMTATDTQKNLVRFVFLIVGVLAGRRGGRRLRPRPQQRLTKKKNQQLQQQQHQVYYVAKRMDKPCSAEEYAAALARYLVAKYPRVSRATVSVEQAPWRRHVGAGAQPHDHCYVASGAEVRTARVVADKSGAVDVVAGARDLRILKTTQSGYVGFLRDAHTALPDATERMMATSVTATWRYGAGAVQGGAGAAPFDYDRAYDLVRSGLLDAAFGPPKAGGVYSPSVQYTLFEMAGSAMRRCPQVESVYLNMPNLHFLPARIVAPPPHDRFEDDVYVATSEPHGTIEAVVTRRQLGAAAAGAAPPHVSKL